MAWVPKKINQDKNDVHASIATSTIKVKKGNNESNKQLSRRCASQHQNLRLAHHPFLFNHAVDAFAMEFIPRYDQLPSMDLF